MEIVDRGSGDPVVLIPGIQGPWAYAAATVSALARVCRVMTFSLSDEPLPSSVPLSNDAMDRYAHQVRLVLESRQIERAAVCGVSFGGLVALRFAAMYPERVSSLILASAPGPHWHLKPRHELYARWPRLFGPIFAVESFFRVRPEVAVALPRIGDRLRFGVRQLITLVRAPISLPRMAERARLIGVTDRVTDSGRIAAPTLIVHGEPSLDHVVDAGGTAEYGTLIRGARVQILERTGHLGSMTRPDTFAGIVRAFVQEKRARSGTAA